MATETKAIPCLGGQWTLVADGKSNVLIKLRRIGRGYVFVGAVIPSTPPSDTTDYVSFTSSSAASLASLAAADKVWVYVDKDAIAEVLRG